LVLDFLRKRRRAKRDHVVVGLPIVAGEGLECEVCGEPFEDDESDDDGPVVVNVRWQAGGAAVEFLCDEDAEAYRGELPFYTTDAIGGAEKRRIEAAAFC
jgi:hypothetical protein